LKIVVFGGTGGTGKNVLASALAAGHDVVAVARRPEALETKHEKLTVVKGDVLDVASIEAAIAGAGAVISTVGPSSMRNPGTLLTDAAKNLVDACSKAGVRVLVWESGVIASDASEQGLFAKFALGMLHTFIAAFTAQKRDSEALITASALDWVIVRPVGLQHTPATGAYKVGPKIAVNLTKQLAHADVADFLVKAATDPQYARQILHIGY
jgi:putative NADH-flavin reductase